MDRVFDVVTTSLMNDTSVTDIVGSRISMGHIATLSEPQFPLVTLEFEVRGDVLVPGAVVRPPIQISSWSLRSFTEAAKILRLIEKNFIDNMPIQNDDLNITLSVLGTPTFAAFSEGESEPRSYSGIQSYDLSVCFK